MFHSVFLILLGLSRGRKKHGFYVTCSDEIIHFSIIHRRGSNIINLRGLSNLPWDLYMQLTKQQEELSI